MCALTKSTYIQESLLKSLRLFPDKGIAQDMQRSHISGLLNPDLEIKCKIGGKRVLRSSLGYELFGARVSPHSVFAHCLRQ